MSAEFELGKCNSTGDFGLWRKKMTALLAQSKAEKALEGPWRLPESMSKEEKDEKCELAYSTIMLHLSDNVLRRVSEIENVAQLWSKLESMYMSKSLTNKINLKEKLFNYKMDLSKGLEENLDEFNTICLELANIGKNMTGENQAVIRL